MKTIYLFDVDGTLTPSRQPMQSDFEKFFRQFVAIHTVYLISGSDYSKMQDQVPIDILKQCAGVFGCAGGEYFEGGKTVYSRDHIFPESFLEICRDYVNKSSYPVRTGNHIEKRTGLINVSVVGRNASADQRKHFFKWDQIHRERASFVNQVNELGFPYEAAAGGEISVDITPRGWNKSVAKAEVLARHPGARLIFYGDRMGEGGNDAPLANALCVEGEPHNAISVNDYRDTWSKLAAISD